MVDDDAAPDGSKCAERDDAGFSSAAISVRIVCIDHYLLPLSEYSSSHPFNIARLKLASTAHSPDARLPVVRIFGSTPAGQKACLHLHGAVPYMYLPVPPGLSSAAIVSLTAELHTALEAGLCALAEREAESGAGSAGGKQAIASMEPVRRTSIYGYERDASIYLKLEAYNPRTIIRIPEVLGSLPDPLACLNLQPFESHIPFHLQVLTDLSLVGMGYVNLSHARFRLPLPPASGDANPARQLRSPNETRVFSDGLQISEPDLVWPFAMPRRAKSELEFDAFFEEVLNARKVEVPENAKGAAGFIAKTLRVLWEEERLRTGATPVARKEEARSINSGAECTDAYLRDKLRALQAGEAPASGPVASITPDGKRATGESGRRQSQESVALSHDPILSASMPSSFDDVFNYLDADAIQDDADGPDGAPDSAGEEEADEDALTQWADIAQCSQSTDDIRPIPQGDGPGDEADEKTPAGRPPGESGSGRRSKLRRKRMRPQPYNPMPVEEVPPLTRSAAPQVFTRERPGSSSIPAPTPRRPLRLTPGAESAPKRARVGSSASQGRRLDNIVQSMQVPSDVPPSSRGASHDQGRNSGAELKGPASGSGRGSQLSTGNIHIFPTRPPSQPYSSKNIRIHSPRKEQPRQPNPPTPRPAIGTQNAPDDDQIEDSADELIAQPSQQRTTVKFSSQQWSGNPSPHQSQPSPHPSESFMLSTPLPLTQTELASGTRGSTSGARSRRRSRTFGGSQTPSDRVLPGQAQSPSPVRQSTVVRKLPLDSPRSPRSTPLQLTQTDGPDRRGSEPVSATCWRPAQAPPSLADLRESQFDEGVTSVVHTPPFYGNPKDAPQKPEVFAGVSFRIPVGGLDNMPACVTPFRDEDDGDVALAKLITPAQRPPTLAELLANDAGNSQKTGPAGTHYVIIDSAGRQNHVHDRNIADSMSQQSSQAPALAGAEAVKWRGSGDGEGEESDSDVSVGEDFLSLSGPRDSPVKQRPVQTAPDRPASPKFGEYRFYPTVASSQQYSDHRHLSRMQSATKTPTTSLHSNQNLTYIAIEILASCIGKKEPDPDQNPILAICAVVVDSRDDVEHKSEMTLLQTSGKSRRLSPSCRVQACPSEEALLDALVSLILRTDPDIITGYETQTASIGYIVERAASIGHALPSAITRDVDRDKPRAVRHDGPPVKESAGARYMRQQGYNLTVKGRHVVNLWRIVRSDVKLACYSAEGVALELLQTRLPRHTSADLEMLLRSPKTAPRALSYVCRRAQLVVDIIEKIDVIGRTGELARVFGVDFMSVLTRGSQFRVESMLARVAHERGFVLLAAQKEQVFAQPAVESLPLVMEPMSALYVDPVIVLDFQSLYPSMIIAHNLCFSTMMGNINRLQSWEDPRQLGVVKGYTPPPVSKFGTNPENNFFVAPNGEMFVTKEERLGILPQMLNEILTTRIMVKAALKAAGKSDAALAKLLNSRQFGLKMIANVTYGYASASFSGRMPCANLADAIVQCGRDALEKMVDYVDNELSETTGASVVYGDTDSLFVRVPGATRAEAFDIGDRIAAKSLELFPAPVRLQLEKVYHPCVLQAKKRYVGYNYESREQAVPTFDAKGIETVRRDSCALVQSTLERSIRVLFETRDLSVVKRLVQRTFQRVLRNRLPLSMYIFRKEVKLGKYKEGHLPPAAIVAARAIARDPRRAPRYGERVPFVVVYAGAGAALKDSVVDPRQLLAAERDGLARLNATYYITKQIIPALDRVLALVGVRVAGWFAEMPRTAFAPLGARLRVGAAGAGAGNAAKNSLYRYYASAKCTLCRGKAVRARVCGECVRDEGARRDARFVLEMRVRRLQRSIADMRTRCAVCIDVAGADPASVECVNLSCELKLGLNAAALKLQGCQDAIADENFW